MEPDNEETVERKDEVDHSAAAVLERESAKEQRAPYEHPEGARDFRVEGNDVRDYVGVDAEYMTYANATEAPMLTDTERYDQTTQYDHLEGNADEELDGDVDDNETPESAAEKQARYEQLLADGVSEHEAREEVWPSETTDSQPGSAGAGSDESQQPGFNPFA